MRVLRWFGLASATALVGGVLWANSVSGAAAFTPTVTILDNDAPGPARGFDPGQGQWGFGPDYMVVKKGEQVMFVSPETNHFPHSVTSITLSGDGAFAGMVAAGAKFDSSPSRETLVQKGSNWMLDTSTLDAGNYGYYCRIHPWMVAKLTVTE